MLHLAVLAALCFGVYANNYHHEYFLDDSHVLSENIAIRNLSNIPRFFTDPSTFSSLRANVDYRPVLQVTYALNYKMGGYDTFWWHFTQILLHLACAVGLYLLCRRVLGMSHPDGREPRYSPWLALLAAALFAVHPTASGVVNYLSARSSLLTAALLLPATLLYMVPIRDPRYRRTPWLAALFFLVALFTKVEAIGCLAVFFLFEVWQAGISGGHQRSLWGDMRATVNRTVISRFWPMAAVAAAYFVVRHQVMLPFALDESRRATGVSSLDYLLTQTVVWWQYVINWFYPLHLVADNGNYPVYRSLLQGPVPFAIGGWLLIGTALIVGWKRRPWLAFLAISALALLSPTSSVAVLAEMLNEHRPYLPVGVLSLTWLIGAGMAASLVVQRWPSTGPVFGLGALAVVSALASFTWRRNSVYSTNRAYLEELVRVAPSARAYNNYGLIYMGEGKYKEALEYFLEAQRLTPAWDVVQVNLGIAYRGLGDSARAESHFDAAVKDDLYSGNALIWRAENHLIRKRYREALTDLEVASRLSLDRYRLCKGLATAYAGLGNAPESMRYTRECLALDRTRAILDAVPIAQPFFEDSGRIAAGLAYFEEYDRLLPGTWWIHANLGTLSARLGDRARAARENALADSLKAK